MADLTFDLSLSAQAGLEWYNASALSAMLRSRSDRWREARSKAEVLALLQTCLFDPVSIRSALEGLDSIAREALALLKQRGGALPVAALSGQIWAWHPELEPEQIRSVPTSLIRRALAFWYTPTVQYRRTLTHDLQRPAAENVYAALIFSPPEILDHVRLPVRLGEACLTPRDRAEITTSPAQWQRRILGLLRAIEGRPPKILQSGLVGARDRELLLQVIAPIEEVPDAPQLSPVNFYRATFEGAGLVETTAERQLRTRPSSLQFVALSPARQARLLLEAWIQSGENELLACSHLLGERHPNLPTAIPEPGRLREARRRLVEVLQEKVLPGHWYDLADVSRLIRHQDVEFLVSWLDPAPYRWSSYEYYHDRSHLRFPPYPGLTLKDSRGRSRALMLGEDWDLVEGAFIRAVFRGPLCWLGLVECRTRSDGRDVFALTPLGAQVFERPGSIAVPDPAEIRSHADALIVQPNFDVVVYAPEEHAELLYHVDRFAERISVDRLAIYRLTQASVCAGLQLGLHVDDVIGTLENASRAPLPQNVVFTLRDWARRFEEVHWIRNAGLLEAPDAEALDRWLADPEIGSAVARRLAPTVALLAEQRPMDLADRLSRQGAEVVTIDAAAPISSCGRVEGHTALWIPARDGHWYLHQELGRIAELALADSQGYRYVITPSSIERACQSGLTSGQILEVLDRVIQGPMPAGLRVRVKGWAGDFGAVEIGQVGVLVAPDAATFRDLLADPGVAGSFIQAIAANAAIVDLEALDRLRQALAARGITARPYHPRGSRLDSHSQVTSRWEVEQ